MIRLTNGIRRAIAHALEPFVREWIREAEFADHPLSLAMQSAVYNNTPGDYLEFGVRRGDSFIRAFHAYEEFRRNLEANVDLKGHAGELPSRMRFFAFDAFEKGLPRPEGVDDTPLQPVHWQGGTMAAELDRFWANCQSSGLDLGRVQTIPGYFHDTLTSDLRVSLSIDQAAVIHLDCDLYASTHTALDFCSPLIRLGTVLVFDDYFRFRGSEAHSQPLALSEWRDSHPHHDFRELARHGGNRIAFICSGAEACE